jgi:hypothetical protein
MTTPLYPADRLALMAEIAAIDLRDRLAAERVPLTLGADIAMLRAAREVLKRRRIASHGMTILDREIAGLEEQLAEVLA